MVELYSDLIWISYRASHIFLERINGTKLISTTLVPSLLVTVSKVNSVPFADISETLFHFGTGTELPSIVPATLY